MTLDSGGYEGEELGVNPPDTTWHSTSELSGSLTAVYYYRDSNVNSNANSSRVDITLKDDWTATINDYNYITVSLKTTLLSVGRTSIIGNPYGTTYTTRHLRFYRQAGGEVLAEYTNDDIGVAHTLFSGELDFGTVEFTLPPGESASRASIYFSNYATGYEQYEPPTTYADIIYMGAEFLNPLPKDYRPGATLQDGEWYSHNRNVGTAKIFDGTKWVEMRTEDGGEATGNPPMIYHSDGWKNMRKKGIED